MADIEDNKIEYTEKSTIKNWFRTGLKPLQNHFWQWMDSYWHKSEKLPISSVDKLEEILTECASLEDLDAYILRTGANLKEEDIELLRKILEVPTINPEELGKVDTVDGVKPDKNKNVNLNALVKNKVNEVGEEFALKKGNTTLSFDEERLRYKTELYNINIGNSHDGAFFDVVRGASDSGQEYHFSIAPHEIQFYADYARWSIATVTEGLSLLKLPKTEKGYRRTLAVSWNGVFADENGNIDVDIVTPIVKDDNNNLITEYVRDNPDKFDIRGERNIILSTNTNPINVMGDDNFLQGRDHQMSNSYYSTAFGQKHTVDGNYSTAFGFSNTVDGNSSTVFGNSNIVRGSSSTVFGRSNYAKGSYNTAFGGNNTVDGNSSTAFGNSNAVDGNSSAAFGIGNIVRGSYNTAFGSYGKAHNELRFSIGIGSDNATRMNALSVFGNGEAWFDELTTVKIDNSKSNKVAITKEYLDLRVPKPPTSGNHVLKSIGGTVQWVAE